MGKTGVIKTPASVKHARFEQKFETEARVCPENRWRNLMYSECCCSKSSPIAQ